MAVRLNWDMSALVPFHHGIRGILKYLDVVVKFVDNIPGGCFLNDDDRRGEIRWWRAVVFNLGLYLLLGDLFLLPRLLQPLLFLFLDHLHVVGLCVSFLRPRH